MNTSWFDSYWVSYQGVVYLFTLTFLGFFTGKWVLLPLFKRFAVKTKTQWDDLVIRYKTSDYMVHLIPAMVLAAGLPYIHAANERLVDILVRLNNVYFVIIAYLILTSFFSVIEAKIQMNPKKHNAPIHGVFQAFKLIGFLICSILVLSQVTNKSPLFLLSGLGALTAVLMLVFRDSILGFVSGIQISTLDLVRTGDWIEMPKYGADGDVVDISLTSVKIQNWDKTISVIPTYELTSSSFKNWRGMSESGGRRIKRSIEIDVNTVAFLDAEQIQALLKIKILRPYLEKKMMEIKDFNQTEFADEDFNALANGRRLTNLGTFRAYCLAYLRNHPHIHQNMTLLVRHLQPNSEGQPVEIYAFTNTIKWDAYEGIQSDIFDHLIAVLPEFNLRMFQHPSGADLRSIRRS